MPFYNSEEKGRPIKIKDEGLTLVNNVASIDLVGDGVSASSIGDDVTQNIPGTGTTDWLLNGNTLGSKKTLGSIDDYGIGFITNNTERLTILNNGNVGIGTTNPTSLLHIQGNYSGGSDNLIPQMKIVNTATTSSYAFIKVMTGTGYSGGYPEFWMQAGNSNADVRVVSNHDLRFWTNNTVK